MTHQTYTCQDMNEYITQKESEDLFTPKRINSATTAKILNFIHEKVKHYDTYTIRPVMISIPPNITTARKLRRWLFTYIKMCTYYTRKYSTENTPLMSTKNPVSIPEIIGKLFNHHRDWHDIYLKTCTAKKEHTSRIYGYTFHTLSLTTFNDIVHELSLFVHC